MLLRLLMMSMNSGISVPSRCAVFTGRRSMELAAAVIVFATCGSTGARQIKKRRRLSDAALDESIFALFVVLQDP